MGFTRWYYKERMEWVWRPKLDNLIDKGLIVSPGMKIDHNLSVKLFRQFPQDIIFLSCAAFLNLHLL